MKDMKTVMDYERKRQLQILKGQCFNNACVIFPATTGLNWNECVYGVSKTYEQHIFEVAMKLYNEAIKNGWLDYEPQ